MQAFTREYKVTGGDLDDLNHVNNIRYLEWVQEIATEHWNIIAPPEWKKDHIWVVRSHTITYHKSAMEGDVLEISTYVDKANGAISERVVDFKRLPSGTLLASCRTQWCLLDRQFRPVRLPQHYLDLFS